MRTNGGGSPQTVTLICSYFFDHSVHTNDTYNRPDDSTIEYWTQPDSSLQALTQMPLYLLTSNKTFSAAEEFAYDLQALKRATIIGETTGGGAHNTFEQPAGAGFVLYIPYGQAVNPITHSNWETVGVQPDIKVPADRALETAEMKIFENLMANTHDPEEQFQLNWQLDLLKANNNPVIIDAKTLQQYAGVYGDRTFTVENGRLYYQRTGKPKFELEAMSSTVMKARGNNYFKIEFIKNQKGKVDQVRAYYQDNRVETSVRTK